MKTKATKGRIDASLNAKKDIIVLKTARLKRLPKCHTGFSCSLTSNRGIKKVGGLGKGKSSLRGSVPSITIPEKGDSVSGTILHFQFV